MPLSVLRAWLTRFRRDQPDRELLTQMRDLWNVPSDWTIPQTAKVVPTRKVKTIADWFHSYAGRKAS